MKNKLLLYSIVCFLFSSISYQSLFGQCTSSNYLTTITLNSAVPDVPSGSFSDYYFDLDIQTLGKISFGTNGRYFTLTDTRTTF